MHGKKAHPFFGSTVKVKKQIRQRNNFGRRQDGLERTCTSMASSYEAPIHDMLIVEISRKAKKPLVGVCREFCGASTMHQQPQKEQYANKQYALFNWIVTRLTINNNQCAYKRLTFDRYDRIKDRKYSEINNHFSDHRSTHTTIQTLYPTRSSDIRSITVIQSTHKQIRFLVQMGRPNSRIWAPQFSPILELGRPITGQPGCTG